jgi:hypothetical protein
LTCRIHCTVGVCKPLLDAVVKSYGIKRKGKVIIIIEVSVKELNASESLLTCRNELIFPAQSPPRTKPRNETLGRKNNLFKVLVIAKAAEPQRLL